MKNYYNLPDGDYQAKVAYITQLPNEVSRYNGKDQKKVEIWYAIHTVYGSDIKKHILISKKYTLSTMYETTSLYKDVKKINPPDLNKYGDLGFDLKKIFNIVFCINLKKDGQYINIDDIKPATFKGFTFDEFIELPKYAIDKSLKIIKGD